MNDAFEQAGAVENNQSLGEENKQGIDRGADTYGELCAREGHSDPRDHSAGFFHFLEKTHPDRNNPGGSGLFNSPDLN